MCLVNAKLVEHNYIFSLLSLFYSYMIHENSEKNALYTVFDGDIGELAAQVTDFCHGKYGDRCEFYTVSIERYHPDDSSWQVHEFDSFDDRSVRAVKNHLKARRDVVKLRFGGSDRDYALDFIICPARNTGQLARYVDNDVLKGMDEGDLVVLSIERKRGEIDEEQKELLKSLAE